MTTQTSLMSEQVRLQELAEQVRDCKNRPRGMNVETWCDQNNMNWILMTKIHYFCSVDEGMTGSKHYFGKGTDFF